MGMATLVGSVGSTQNFLPPNRLELSFYSFGVFGFFKYFMTKAFQQGEASKVAPIKYVEVIFTLVLVCIYSVKSIPFKAYWGWLWSLAD